MAVPPPPLIPPPLLSAPVVPSVTSTGGWKPPVIQPCVRSGVELVQDVVTAVEKRFSDTTDELNYDQKWLNAFRPVQPLLQDGPMCGLVALSMAASVLAPGWLAGLSKCDGSRSDSDLPQSVDEGTAALLSLARERGFSRNGEMFSAEWLSCLSRECCGLRAECCAAATLTEPNNLASRLLAGQLLLVPFDIDKDGTPFSAGGHKAHWALITGVLQAHSRDCRIWAHCPGIAMATCSARRTDVSIGESGVGGGGGGDAIVGSDSVNVGNSIIVGCGGGAELIGDRGSGGSSAGSGDGGDVVIGGSSSGTIDGGGGDIAIGGDGGRVHIDRVASAADHARTDTVMQPSSLCSCRGDAAPEQQPAAVTYVTGRHGKSRRVAVWSLSDLAASNAQLSEDDPAAAAGRPCACPAAGLRDGLCGKVVWLSS